MKYIFTTFLIFIQILFANASDYSVIIEKPFNSALFDITQDYDRDITAVGFSRSYQKSNDTQTYTNAFDYLASVANTHGSQINLIKLDKAANIILDKRLKLSRFNEAIAVVKTPNNGYFIGGYTLDGSLLIVKMNSNGSIVFTKEFGTKNYDRMNNLILMSDGGVLAIGSSITSRSANDNIFETGLGLNDIYLTRFSKNGQKLWSKKYGTQYDDRGIDAVEARDGSIVVISSTKYDKNKNVTLMRITENGNKIWLKHYKSELKTTPYRIIRLRDGNFVVSLSHTNEMNQEQIRLIKFDLQRNVLQDKEIFTTYSSFLTDIKEFSDGTFAAVGSVRDTYNTNGLAMVLDQELDQLYQDNYGDENFDAFNSLVILNNSQIAVAGVNTHENSQEMNMWVVKLNRDLTIASKSSKSIDIYKELLKIFKTDIYEGKISIKEDLSINFEKNSLLFKVGEYALTKAQKEYLDSFSKRLLPFLKSHQAYIDTLEVNGHTSSEWGQNNFTNRYLKNEKLSMNRSYTTISYIFQKQDIKTQEWLSKVLRGSGFASSKKVIYNKIENKEKSRRVSFKILLN